MLYVRSTIFHEVQVFALYWRSARLSLMEEEPPGASHKFDSFLGLLRLKH
jgi:hypothetical protein